MQDGGAKHVVQCYIKSASSLTACLRCRVQLYRVPRPGLVNQKGSQPYSTAECFYVYCISQRFTAFYSVSMVTITILIILTLSPLWNEVRESDITLILTQATKLSSDAISFEYLQENESRVKVFVRLANVSELLNQQKPASNTEALPKAICAFCERLRVCEKQSSDDVSDNKNNDKNTWPPLTKRVKVTRNCFLLLRFNYSHQYRLIATAFIFGVKVNSALMLLRSHKRFRKLPVVN